MQASDSQYGNDDVQRASLVLIQNFGQFFSHGLTLRESNKEFFCAKDLMCAAFLADVVTGIGLDSVNFTAAVQAESGIV